jgi:hypothetical protein
MLAVCFTGGEKCANESSGTKLFVHDVNRSALPQRRTVRGIFMVRSSPDIQASPETKRVSAAGFRKFALQAFTLAGKLVKGVRFCQRKGGRDDRASFAPVNPCLVPPLSQETFFPARHFSPCKCPVFAAGIAVANQTRKGFMTDALSNDPNHFAAKKSLDAVAPRQEPIVTHLADVPPQPVVIPMEEASVSFQRMVEVHNRLLDSYQELMRMRV